MSTTTTTTTTTTAPTLISVQRDIRARWTDIVDSAGLRGAARIAALRALPKAPRLLGSSVKVKKGEALGILSSVIYLSPATEGTPQGRTLCPHATEACALACLGKEAGRMIMRPMERARRWKAALYLGDRASFRALILAEARGFAARAAREGLVPAIRIDGSSDTGEGERMREALRALGVQGWDYTKSLRRAARLARRGDDGTGYSLTYSHGASEAETLEALRAGCGAAVVFSTGRGEALPTEWNGFPVIDGDITDARFLDRSEGGAPARGGYVVGLRFKAARNRSEALRAAIAGGFVVPA
jgi:hypothetical protein